MRDNDETTAPEPHTGLQGESGACGTEGGETLAEIAQAFDVHPNQVTQSKTALLEGAAGVFGTGGADPAAAAVDVKSLHGKIGQLTLENDFLSGALDKAGLLSAKR